MRWAPVSLVTWRPTLAYTRTVHRGCHKSQRCETELAHFRLRVPWSTLNRVGSLPAPIPTSRNIRVRFGVVYICWVVASRGRWGALWAGDSWRRANALDACRSIMLNDAASSFGISIMFRAVPQFRSRSAEIFPDFRMRPDFGFHWLISAINDNKEQKLCVGLL